MKVLVTGANGYLGLGVVKQLLQDGIEVVAADFMTDKVDDRAQRVECDLFSIEDPYEFFGRPDVVLHMAWRDGFVHNSEAHLADLYAHHVFLEKLFKSEINLVAVMGSMHEIGFFEGSINEDTPCHPVTLYGISKNALRLDVEKMSKEYNKKYLWLRGYYIVGNTAYGSSIFSKLYKAAQEGKESFPFTMGLNQFDFTDYDEFCLMTASAVEQSDVTGIVNISTGRPEKLADRVERFIKDNGFSIKLQYGAFPDRPYDSKAVWGNSAKIESILSSRENAMRKIKVFVTGVGGQLGHDVMNELASRGLEGVGSDIAPVYSGVADGSSVTSMPYVQLDITDSDAVMSVISEVKPDVIVHCAAWTAVDAAEDEENKAKVHAINVDGTAAMAKAAASVGAKIFYISTDYVFNGEGVTPWKPDCKDYAPVNYYGQTKLEGELAVAGATDKFFIVRIAWVFGRNGKNFIKTMLNVGKTHDMVRVVNDQIGTPTYTIDLARLLVDMAETDKYGYYHATNEGGYISWYDLTCEIYKQAGMSDRVKVEPVTTEEYGLSKAARPKNSRLDKSKLAEAGFTPLPTWQDALGRFLKEVEE